MIALLLFDMPFEQDIRELFMAFYPGRTYIYKADPQAGIIFTGRRIDNPDGGIYDVELIFGSHTYGYKTGENCCKYDGIGLFNSGSS